MTNEEAIKILEELPDKILCIIRPKDKPYDYEQALRLAIEALKEPSYKESSDCDRRKAGNCPFLY